MPLRLCSLLFVFRFSIQTVRNSSGSRLVDYPQHIPQLAWRTRIIRSQAVPLPPGPTALKIKLHKTNRTSCKPAISPASFVACLPNGSFTRDLPTLTAANKLTKASLGRPIQPKQGDSSLWESLKYAGTVITAPLTRWPTKACEPVQNGIASVSGFKPANKDAHWKSYIAAGINLLASAVCFIFVKILSSLQCFEQGSISRPHEIEKSVRVNKYQSPGIRDETPHALPRVMEEISSGWNLLSTPWYTTCVWVDQDGSRKRRQ